MPATLVRQNDFTSQAVGTDVTEANSGGGSNDAFSLKAVGAGSSIKYATMSDGKPCAEFIMPSVSAAATWLQWAGLALAVPVFSRIYIEKVTNPWTQPGTWFDTVRGIADAAGARCWVHRNTAAGVFSATNAADAAIAGAAFTNPLPAPGSVVRIETRVVPSTTAGEVTMRFYDDPDAAVGDFLEEKAGTSNGSLVLAAVMDGARYGVVSTPANMAGLTWRYAYPAIGIGDWLGPAADPVAPTAAVDYSCFPKYKLRTADPRTLI